MLVEVRQLLVLDAELPVLVAARSVDGAIRRQHHQVVLAQCQRLDPLRYRQQLRNALLEVKLGVRADRERAARPATEVLAHEEARAVSGEEPGQPLVRFDRHDL